MSGIRFLRRSTALFVLFVATGCKQEASVSRIPEGQGEVVAHIAATTSDKPAPRTGGILFPQTVGREIRAQAIRPPTPGPLPPPPAGT